MSLGDTLSAVLFSVGPYATAGICPSARKRRILLLPNCFLASAATLMVCMTFSNLRFASHEQRAHRIISVNPSNGFSEQSSDRDVPNLLARARLGARRDGVRNDDFLERRVFYSLHRWAAEHAVRRDGNDSP